MGYTTDFRGKLILNKKLTKKDNEFLVKFAETRRMARNVDPKYGVEGEFYVDGRDEFFSTDKDKDIIDYNRPPKTQPGLWCQWVPSEDGLGIEWDGGEKFYNYVEWLEYIIKNFLAPKGYVLMGTVEWRGEEWDDRGEIRVFNNEVTSEYV